MVPLLPETFFQKCKKDFQWDGIHLFDIPNKTDGDKNSLWSSETENIEW